jgi:hypothetical protein
MKLYKVSQLILTDINFDSKERIETIKLHLISVPFQEFICCFDLHNGKRIIPILKFQWAAVSKYGIGARKSNKISPTTSCHGSG